MNDSLEEKRLIWEQIANKFRLQTDGLGKLLDEGIFDTVVALNVLGISTSASCEGHIDWGEAGSWVDIQPIETKSTDKLFQENRKRYELITKKRVEGVTEEKLAKYWDKYHKVEAEIRKPTLILAQRIINLLNEFYLERLVLVDRRLVVCRLGWITVRLENQGSMIQEIDSLESQKKKLGEYQVEMRDFTTFLRSKFFDI